MPGEEFYLYGRRLTTEQVNPCLLAVGSVLEYRDLLAASGGSSSPPKSPKSFKAPTPPRSKEADQQLAELLQKSHSATQQVMAIGASCSDCQASGCCLRSSHLLCPG